jgi:hypothetical protein
MRFRGPVEATALVLAALALACVLTYPYALKLDHAGRVDTNDGRWSIWVVSWVAHALTTDPLNVYRANIFYPHQNALAFSEANLVEGALAAPVWLLTRNPYTTHNVLFIFSFVLSTAGGYYLVRYLSGDRRAAAVAGVLFAYCPFVFARTAHVQLLMIGFLPWCMLSFHRLVDRTTVPRAIELGVMLWITGLACAYYGIFAGGMVALGTTWLAVSRGRWRQPRFAIAMALAAAVCIGLTLPLFLPYLDLQQETGFARSLDDARRYSANAGAWLASSAWAHRWWLPYIGNDPATRLPAFEPFSEVLFPGITAIVVGIAGAWLGLRGARPRQIADRTDGDHLTAPIDGAPRSRFDRDIVWFYIVTALIAFWTTLGPKAGLYTLLHNTVPVFSFLRAPARTGIVVSLCLVVLGSIVMTRWMRGRRAWMVFAALLAVAIADLAQAPLRMRDAQPLSHVYQTLALLPKAPVIELPYWYNRPEFPRHAEYMLASTAHWHHLVNGYSDLIPQDFRRTVLPLSSFPSTESFGILEDLGARYAIFHLDLTDPRTREKLITRIEVDYRDYLRPLERDGEVWLYEIVAWPPRQVPN